MTPMGSSREHVEFPKTSTTNDHCDCNLLIRCQNLTSPFCKPTHTFMQPHVPRQSPDQQDPHDLMPGPLLKTAKDSAIPPRQPLGN
ncbi:hypothetical protein KIL84_008396 [Mauremys mutica]|uniref:Uncharacterized protein n=1 Tax=Mauremys mutica TaxID=74926 RepID=A0A9D3X8P7_9SAUR|nr:hypothetical protein KIL84_008396 [Mauremys mutica]